MPNNSQSVVQNYEVKRGSQSCSTTCGTPKLCTIMVEKQMYYRQHRELPSPTTMGISLTHLVSLSTTVNTPLNDPLSGRSVMKSIDHTKKRSAGVSIGYNKPAGAEVKSSAAGKPGTHAQMQRPLMQQARPPNTAKQRNMKSCRYLSVHQVHNASLTTKASKVHHQVE